MRRMYFKPAHRDKAEPAIVDALRKAGATVYPISGKDIPDLLVGFRGRTFLLEVKSIITNERKDGYKRTAKTAVSAGQKAFIATWRGGLVRVVHTPEEALYAIGLGVEDILPPMTKKAPPSEG